MLLAVAVMLASPLANAATDELKCDVGPISRNYGNTAWLVYSCSDRHSVVIVSAPGNPAAPFYFIVHPGDGGYQIEGEGTGAKAESDAALAEIKTLSATQINALIEQTKNPQKSD